MNLNLKEMLRRNLEREWLEEDATPECFDHDEANMDCLLKFLEKRATPEEDIIVCNHLCECARCRYLYIIYREVNGEL